MGQWGGGWFAGCGEGEAGLGGWRGRRLGGEGMNGREQGGGGMTGGHGTGFRYVLVTFGTAQVTLGVVGFSRVRESTDNVVCDSSQQLPLSWCA